MAEEHLRTPFAVSDPEALERHIAEETGVSTTVYDRSVREKEGRLYAMARLAGERRLVVVGAQAPGFEVQTTIAGADATLHLCPCSPENAQRLRDAFPWTGPEPLGRTSALGCGDRLGVATPGHIQACREAGVVPVLAQQSIREMERTGRSPQQVLDDATWAVFREGYTAGFGADADHLKTEANVDACFEVGYTMYTIDPSDHVDNAADELGGERLSAAFDALPWEALDATPEVYRDRYLGDPIEVKAEGTAVEVTFTPETLQRAAVKYGAALAHTRHLAQHLASRYASDRPDETYDLEMSVDETSTPTRPREHYFVAAELERLGVDVTSLAPRFVGRFEKGIDYVGDLDEFERSFRAHSTIARAHGEYKLSIHSGSDKFSVFPIIGRYAGDCVHLKTAGTSFLEALRIPARHAPDFFRDIVGFAFERFEEDRKTYHVSTNTDVIPDPHQVADEDLESTYLEEDNGRQLLHITYGSILSAAADGEPRFKHRLLSLLDEHEDEHFAALKSHVLDHIESVGEMTTRTDES